MSTDIIPFAFGDNLVRVIERDDEPWFVLADVCRVLGIGNPSQAASRLDEEEKGIISTDTPSSPQQMLTINESGLYALIFTSRKEAAKQFRKWVTAEVLPAIRKTGRYDAHTAPQAAAEPPRESSVLKDRLIEAQQKLIAKQERVAQIEAEEKRLVHRCADILIVETGLSDEEIANHVKGMWGGDLMPEWVAWRRRKVKETLSM